MSHILFQSSDFSRKCQKSPFIIYAFLCLFDIQLQTLIALKEIDIF